MGVPIEDRLRSFDPADLDSVRELIHLTIDRCYAGVYPPRAVAFFKELHSREGILRRHAEGLVLVAERGGGIVATGSLVGDEIGGVFVLPALQGRGIGGRVMDGLESAAGSGGNASVRLSVSLPSRGFYEARGYSVGGMLSCGLGGGECLDYWEAAKPLSAGESQSFPR